MRDGAIFVLVKLSGFSLDRASGIVTLCTDHLSVCRNCIETLTVFNALCTHSANARAASALPLIHNRIIDLLSSCLSTLPGKMSLCAVLNMKETTLCSSVEDPKIQIRADESPSLRRPPPIAGPSAKKRETRKELLERSVQSEPVEDSAKNRGSNILRTNYYTNQTVTRIARRQQNRNPGDPPLSTSPMTRPPIPRLNINSLAVDASPGGAVQTRSSRRGDVTKSASTRSAQYSAIFSTSFDHFHSHSGNLLQESNKISDEGTCAAAAGAE